MPPPAPYRSGSAGLASPTGSRMTLYGGTTMRRPKSRTDLAGMHGANTAIRSPRHKPKRVVRVEVPEVPTNIAYIIPKAKVSPMAHSGQRGNYRNPSYLHEEEDLEVQRRHDRFRVPPMALWPFRLQVLVRARPLALVATILVLALVTTRVSHYDSPAHAFWPAGTSGGASTSNAAALVAGRAPGPTAGKVAGSGRVAVASAYPSWSEMGNAHVLLTEFAANWKPLQNSFYLRHLEALTVPALQAFHDDGAEFFWLLQFPEGTNAASFEDPTDYQRVLDLGKNLGFAIVLISNTRDASIGVSKGTDILGADVLALCSRAMAQDAGATFPHLGADMFQHEQMLSVTWLPPGVGLSKNFLIKVQRKVQGWNQARRSQGTWPPEAELRTPLPVPKQFASVAQQLMDDGGEGAVGPALALCTFQQSHWMMQRSPTASGFISTPHSDGQCSAEALTVTMSSADRVKAFKPGLIIQGSTRWFRGMVVDLVVPGQPEDQGSAFSIVPQMTTKDYSSLSNRRSGVFSVDEDKLLLANRFVTSHLKAFEDLNAQLESEAATQRLVDGLGA